MTAVMTVLQEFVNRSTCLKIELHSEIQRLVNSIGFKMLSVLKD